jgi:phage repressor protein C with HTH and peptisase S24 domain
MGSDITRRFIECLQDLKDRNVVRSFRQLAKDLDFLPQNLSDMKTGKRDVTIKLLGVAIRRYHLNAEYIFRGEGAKILKPEDRLSQMKVLSVVTDSDNNERIVHVPLPAQAGYASQSKDPEFIENLPTYSLPDYRFKTGTYRSFDVAGDSMEPTFHESDRLICSFVEPSMWNTSIKNGQVYVIVTRDDIFVKRLDASRRQYLSLHSDNVEFDPFRVHLSDVVELWHVKLKISTFDHFERPPSGSNDGDSVEYLKRMIENQGEQIQLLMEQLKQPTEFEM